jgi:hypothetical protein
VIGGNADDTFGVGSVVMAEQPITEVAVAGTKVGSRGEACVEDEVGFEPCPGEHELSDRRIRRGKTQR